MKGMRVIKNPSNVHPVPPPKSEINERKRERYERQRIETEKLLTLGYTTSCSWNPSTNNSRT